MLKPMLLLTLKTELNLSKHKSSFGFSQILDYIFTEMYLLTQIDYKESFIFCFGWMRSNLVSKTLPQIILFITQTYMGLDPISNKTPLFKHVVGFQLASWVSA